MATKRNVQAGRNKYYLHRSVEIFPRLNEHSLAIRLIRRATYTLPICYCDALIENGIPDMTARNNISSATVRVADGVEPSEKE